MSGGHHASRPLVSVVLPTRDRAGWVGRAVESVLAQSYRPIEVIVVDDGSRDHTGDVLASFGPSITVLSDGRRGAYAARNLGWRHATGDLVAFIDSDDAWDRDRLVSQVPLMRRAAVGLVFGDARRVRPSGSGMQSLGRTCFGVTPPRRGYVADHFVWGNFIPTVAVLVRRACLEEVGGFPASHAVSADYLTWFRIALRHEIDYVSHTVADYTVHEDGISHDLGRSLEARIDLFAGELRATTDPAVRLLLQHLVVNLGLHLALAALRHRARHVDGAWNVVARALAVAPGDLAPFVSSFVAHQALLRTRRCSDAASPDRNRCAS